MLCWYFSDAKLPFELNGIFKSVKTKGVDFQNCQYVKSKGVRCIENSSKNDAKFDNSHRGYFDASIARCKSACEFNARSEIPLF